MTSLTATDTNAPDRSRTIPRPSGRARMKIVMVTNNALEDKVGGHERYVRELASALAQRDLDVTIVAKRWTPDTPGRERCSDGVVIDRYDVPSKRNPLYAAAFVPYVMRGVAARTDRSSANTIVHAHMALQALPLAVQHRPYLFTFHAPVWRELLDERQGSYLLPRPVQAPAVAALRRVERVVTSRAAQSVVLSEFMRGELAVLDPRAADRALVLPGGIDARRFHPTAPDRTLDRPPASDEPPVLFTARRLTPRTGVDELIRAMPSILEARPGTTLKIAGSGGMQPGLEALASQLGIRRNVEFLGRVKDDELTGWYRRATLVVLPTQELEGFGLTTAEALACGAAVVGTPAGATPELLAPLDPGLVTRDVSAGAIATAVLGLLDDPARLARIRASAPGRILPAMSWDRIAERYIERYEELAG
jgi:glycosyltransferase involved in cell wall biosynthesis